ncbi:MAG: YqgE/AlgH family protein, partial [Woeseiaceae bacterium]
MHPDGSLTNQLLIAMPGMLDPNFSTTVTLVCEHNDEGALGIVINRPTTLQLRELFEQLSVDDADA